MKQGMTLSQMATILEDRKENGVDHRVTTESIEFVPTPEPTPEPEERVGDAFRDDGHETLAAIVDHMESQPEPEPVERLPEETPTSMMVGGIPLELNNWSTQQVANFLEIPTRYIRTLQADDQELLRENFNRRMSRRCGERLIREYDGGAIAFLSNRYMKLDSADVANEVLEMLVNEYPGVQVESMDLTEKRMYLKFVTPKLQGEVTKGDIVQAGVQVSNSDVGAARLSVNPLIFRLVCVNGLVVPETLGVGFNRVHLGRRLDLRDLREEEVTLMEEVTRKESAKILRDARNAVEDALDESKFQIVLEKMIQTTERKITGDPNEAMEEVARRFGFRTTDRGGGQNEKAGILRHLIKGGDLSQWGVVNAVTDYSKEVSTYERASEIETIGGKILDMPDNQWERVATAA